ncbi:MAG: heme ABC exporter ATP-binding protein CcmA [Ruminococcus sp.]|nr:heme ABC exporter ATP-binding protein CcmA [Ruminococcus sp.]
MIEVSDIKKRYGKKQVLSDISFQANCGECVVIVGRNGCGKTTLMQILAGVVKPDGGGIRYFGNDPVKQKKHFREFCGYVPQENPLIEELTVKDNLKLWGADRGEEYARVLEVFQLQDLMKTEVSKLSGGMKRRLSIACALAGWPPILLLDEPVTALDLYYKESIEKWLEEYKSMNGIVVMTTHDEKEIMDCDRCLLMKDGKLKELDKASLSIQQIKQMM